MEREAAGSPGIHHISTVKRNIMRERGVDAYRLPIVSAGKPDARATTSCHQGDDIPGEKYKERRGSIQSASTRKRKVEARRTTRER